MSHCSFRALAHTQNLRPGFALELDTFNTHGSLHSQLGATPPVPPQPQASEQPSPLRDETLGGRSIGGWSGIEIPTKVGGCGPGVGRAAHLLRQPQDREAQHKPAALGLHEQPSFGGRVVTLRVPPPRVSVADIALVEISYPIENGGSRAQEMRSPL